jgi:hypothetical protein
VQFRNFVNFLFFDHRPTCSSSFSNFQSFILSPRTMRESDVLMGQRLFYSNCAVNYLSAVKPLNRLETKFVKHSSTMLCYFSRGRSSFCPQQCCFPVHSIFLTTFIPSCISLTSPITYQTFPPSFPPSNDTMSPSYG